MWLAALRIRHKLVLHEEVAKVFKGLKNAMSDAKSVNELGKRYPEDVAVYNALGFAFMGKDETIETSVRQVSPDHLVQFRWRDGKFMRPGIRYVSEVDPSERRVAAYFLTSPMSGSSVTLVQQFVNSALHPIALEVVTRFNNANLMGHVATLGQTPPYSYNGQSSFVYGFAAALDYSRAVKAPAQMELLENITEATADAAVRFGQAIYHLAHDQKRQTAVDALKAMPKSKVQKGMKDSERRHVAEAFASALVGAGLSLSPNGAYAWTVARNSGITDAYVAESGHLVIENRLSSPVSQERRMATAGLIDQANGQLLGKMGHIALDLDSGKVVYRTGFRAYRGHNLADKPLLDGMIAEHLRMAALLNPRLDACIAGRLSEPIILPEWSLVSESRQVALGARFMFGA